jgi:hypothetical protein
MEAVGRCMGKRQKGGGEGEGGGAERAPKGQRGWLRLIGT